MILGVIADDFTGATDVASMLVRGGMRTVQVLGVPSDRLLGADGSGVDAAVVALKSRTIAAADAVQQSVKAMAALRQAGARQIYFKYCSTFDSTPQGNIGPVIDALMQALHADFTIACPALPENGRTVYRGHLFVGDQPLHETGMRGHPLTPMTDANLVRVLQPQTRRQVGLWRHGEDGAQAMPRLRSEGVQIAIADAIDNQDLQTLAHACAGLPLLTGGSGLALALSAVYSARGWIQPNAHAAVLEPAEGPAAVLAGSCSEATQAQVAAWRAAGNATLALDPRALDAEAVLAQAKTMVEKAPVLVYATMPADEVRAVQAELGAAEAGARVERAMAHIARGLVQAGVRRMVVAGGETAGAVVQSLGVAQLRIGGAICPGVPWTQAALPQQQHEPMWLALKSGNFGGPLFFAEALQAAGVRS